MAVQVPIGIAIDEQMVRSVVTLESISFDIKRRSHSQNGLSRAVGIDIAGTHVQGLVEISDEVNEEPKRIALAEPQRSRAAWLEDTNAHINHVDDIVGVVNLTGFISQAS